MMKISIDGIEVTVQKNETLLDCCHRAGLYSTSLSSQPLAAKIAGEVFTLNYVPIRDKEAQSSNHATRRAMEVSNGEITLLRYSDPMGKDVYIRSAHFIIFWALHTLYPTAIGSIQCTLGQSVYIRVENAPEFSVERLKEEIRRCISRNVPIKRYHRPIQDAAAYYKEKNREDRIRLLQWKASEYIDEYSVEDFSDYFCGEMLPSTGNVTVWDILPAEKGFIFIYPDDKNPDRPADFNEMPHFFEVFKEGENWCRSLNCQTIADLNEKTVHGELEELIRVNEALHEKSFSQIADMICKRGAKLIFLAGPSSSGKTTSANRLATQLRVHGKKPILISLDDYYLDRDSIQPGPDGKLDLEHINTIDVALFQKNMEQLLQGEEVEIPRFNFITGKRESNGAIIQLSADSVIITEGIHGLNPQMVPQDMDRNLIFRLYVSPLIPLNLDNHNRIPTTYLRLLRRIVRDYATRGASVQRTLSMWESVQQGERRWIYPFQENADVIFNSSTLYELAILKSHIFPLLQAIEPGNPCYEEVCGIIKYLEYVLPADAEDEIPPTSIVREFIGGNSFYKKKKR